MVYFNSWTAYNSAIYVNRIFDVKVNQFLQLPVIIGKVILVIRYTHFFYGVSSRYDVKEIIKFSFFPLV